MKYTYSPDDDEREEQGHESVINAETSLGIDQNIVGLLAYFFWWATGIAFLQIEKENIFVRFHAMQSIAVFVPLTIAWILASFIPFIGAFLATVLTIIGVCLWLFLMFQAFIGARYKIPIAGDWAEAQIKGTDSK